MNSSGPYLKVRGMRIESGFTLVELMVALVLSLLLAAAAMVMHISGRASFLDVEKMSRMQENVRFASDYLIRDVRNAGYRDETFLRSGHFEQIKEGYASIGILDGSGNFQDEDDGDILRIRYAGRGHCTEAFDEFRLVENEYSLNFFGTGTTANGELTCRGRTVPRDAPGDTLITDQAFSTPVGLVTGITGIAFQRICPNGGIGCVCDQVNDFDNSCIGVRIALQFEGLRELDTAEFADRSVELTAAFRNIILDRVNAAAFP